MYKHNQHCILKHRDVMLFSNCKQLNSFSKIVFTQFDWCGTHSASYF